MKTTNKEHIIKEKLQGVDLPDMDTSWQKMEQSIEAVVPVQGGWSAFLAKYKIYLNLFIVAITIGAIGLYVKSKTHSTPEVLNSIESVPMSHTSYLTFNTVIDHNNDLPVPSSPRVAKTIYVPVTPPKPIEKIDTLANDNIIIEEIIEKPAQPIVQYFDTIVENIQIDDVELHRTLEPQFHYVHNQVGAKLQFGVLPSINGQGILQTTGFALYGRRFFTDRAAIHVELGYNPIAIRPITYVEKYNVFNNFNYSQTDIATVTGLRYVTIPVNLYIQLSPKISINAGPQISFLTGLSGDLTRKFNYPTAPETASVTENRSIDNKGGFNKTDIGFNIEFTVHKGRIETGLRLQQSFGDYTSNQLSRQKHSFNTLQLKLSWLLNE